MFVALFLLLLLLPLLLLFLFLVFHTLSAIRVNSRSVIIMKNKSLKNTLIFYDFVIIHHTCKRPSTPAHAYYFPGDII